MSWRARVSAAPSSIRSVFWRPVARRTLPTRRHLFDGGSAAAATLASGKAKSLLVLCGGGVTFALVSSINSLGPY